MRKGGPFPFLSAADEVSMHIELHMRRCGAARKPSGEVGQATPLSSTDLKKARTLGEPENDQLRWRRPADDCFWQKHQRVWAAGGEASVPDGFHNSPSSGSTSASSGQYQRWAQASHEYMQRTHVESHLTQPVAPQQNHGRSYVDDAFNQRRYGRKPCHPLLDEPQQNAPWEGAAASCTSSSQSSSESCYSSGNVQSPAANHSSVRSTSDSMT